MITTLFMRQTATAVAQMIQNLSVNWSVFVILNTAPFQPRVIPFERGDQKAYNSVKKCSRFKHQHGKLNKTVYHQRLD